MCKFDNIEYLAKTKQLRYGVHAYVSLRGDEGVKQCTHTLACVVLKGLNAYISLRGDEGVKQCTHTLACVVLKGLNAYISLRGDEGVNQCTRAFRACSFTA